MTCAKCGKSLVEGKCPTPGCDGIRDEKKSDIQRILDGIEKMAARPAEPPAPVRAEPPPKKTGPVVPDDIAEEYQRLLNSGDGKAAIELQMKYMNDTTFAPVQGLLGQITNATVQANLAQMRVKYGEKFTKREPLFQKVQAEMQVPDAWLVNMDTVERIFSLVIGQDRDKYVEEESASRIEAARAEAQKAAAGGLGNLAPAQSILNLFPEEDRDHVEDVLTNPKKAGLSEEEIIYFKRQVAFYNERGANVTWQDVIRQVEKEFDPNYTSMTGAGRYKRRGWTQVGEHPDDQTRIDAARRKAILGGTA